MLNLLLMGCLAGCAAPAAKRAVLAAPAPAMQGGLAHGRVVAVREAEIGADAGSRAGVDAVLSALGQPLAPAIVSLQEVVIEQPDGDPLSLGGTFPNIAVGDRVTLVAGPATLLVPGD